MEPKNKTINIESLLISLLIVVLPFEVFFCYNMGKYSNFWDTLTGTINHYIPVLSICVVAFILFYRFLVKKKS